MSLNSLRISLILLIAAVSTHAATLSGTIRDSEGAIANAHVVIHWDSTSRNHNVGISEDKVISTDVNGKFSLELPSGLYDIFVAATAFSPHCEKIRMKGSEPRTYEIRLKVSEVASEGLD
jgi:hypothetical protein